MGLAKLALWLESYAEGLPLTFMDHRLVAGDSLTGPFLEHLATLPGRGEKMSDDLFEQAGAKLLGKRIAESLGYVRALEASVGKDVAEVIEKRVAKERLDHALEPLRGLARVWSGGVMLGGEACDDQGYAELISVATHEEADAIPAMKQVFAGNARLRAMREAGAEAVAYELTFPEVFWPVGYAGTRKGFDAVIGNPPWDALQPLAKEFFATYDLRVLESPTRRERTEVEERVSRDPAVAVAFRSYVASFERAKRLLDRVYRHVGRTAGGLPSGAVTDLWQPFAERGLAVLRESGTVGTVVPSAFHANQSATGIRTLYIEQSALRYCFSFENLRKLFEIDSRFKFALVVATRGGGAADEIACGFYLDDPEWLFRKEDPLVFDRAFVRATGGEYLSMMELRSKTAADVAATMYRGARAMGAIRLELHIRPGEEMHMSKCAHLFTPTSDVLPYEDPREPNEAEALRVRGYFPLHEGKTFHQYNDKWEDRPRYLVALAAIEDKTAWRDAARYYRLAFRDIASSTNERTGIFAVLPPRILCGNKAPCEREPSKRPNARVLLFVAVANSHTFDWTLRLKVSATVNLFILDGCPVPTVAFEVPRDRFLAHSALRLTCNHAGYAPLWREQLGDLWREPGRNAYDWPAVSGDESRWGLRAAIDAVVADAYGLTRAQYEHVLAGFSHKSYPAAPVRCLAAYDALKRDGLEAFVRANDPYWDVPQVETLPKPVIELSVPKAVGDVTEAPRGQLGLAGFEDNANTNAKKTTRKKKG